MESELEQLRQSAIFSGLSTENLDLMARAMPRRCVPANLTVFEQDCPGDSLFVLVQGRVAVRFKREGKRGLVVAEALPGTVFGEMACIDPSPRTATLDVIDDAVVYELPRSTLLSLRHNAPALSAMIVGGITRVVSDRLREIDDLLQTRLPSHPRQSTAPETGPASEKQWSEVQTPLNPAHVVLPSGFDGSDLELLQGAGRTWVVDTGALLCRQGEIGRSCFVLLRGELDVLRDGESGPVFLGVLEPDTIVGQMALVDNTPRSASLRVRHKAVVIELARDDFERLISAATPFALRFQELLAVAGIRQLRAAIDVLKVSPDPASKKKPEADRGSRTSAEEDNEQKAAARFLASLKEWGLGIDGSSEISYVDHDGEMGEKEMETRAGG